jgi:predicted dinucleotide-binding enzyme
VLAVPWREVEAAVASLGGLAGKIVVDVTNPVGPGFSLAKGSDDSIGETTARAAPGARVVKAFNITGAGNMVDSRYPGGKLMMPIAGDDVDAKRVVAGLAADLGFDPVDVGPLTMSRNLEQMALLWIRLALVEKLGPNIGYALLRR